MELTQSTPRSQDICYNRERDHRNSGYRIYDIIKKIHTKLPTRNIPQLREISEQWKISMQEIPKGIDSKMPLAIAMLFLLIILQMCEFFFHGLFFSYQNFRQLDIITPLQIFFVGVGVAHILINLTFSLENQGLYIIHLQEIMRIYVSGLLILDLIQLALQIAGIWVWQMNGIVLLIKMIQLYYLQNKIKFVLVNSNAKEAIWSMVFFFFFNIIIAFIFALIFFHIARIDPDNNWLSTSPIKAKDWYDRFYLSFYLSVTTLLTIGFGDISPATPFEALLFSMCELFGAIIFAYFIGSISAFINNLSQISSNFEKNARVMHQFLERQQIDDVNIRTAVLNDVKNQVKIHQNGNFALENSILSQLQVSLKNSILQILLAPALQNLPFFSNLSEQSRNDITSCLQKKIFLTGQILPKDDQKVLVLLKGHVEKCIKLNNQLFIMDEIQASKDHARTINLQETLQKSEDRFIYRTSGYCEVFQISVEYIKRYLKKNKKYEYPIICEEIDRVQFNKELTYELDCQICPAAKHTIIQCPQYHYITPDKLFENSQNLMQEFRRHRTPLCTVFDKMKEPIRRNSLRQRDKIELVFPRKVKQSVKDFEKYREWKNYFPKSNLKRQQNQIGRKNTF